MIAKDSKLNRRYFESEIVILGICRDVDKVINQSLADLKSAFGPFSRIHIRVIESDSQDNTIQSLRDWKLSHPDFDFRSLGQLEKVIPNRWQRIAFCRTQVSDFVRFDEKLANCRYIVVADLDGINSGLTAASVSSCWVRDDWDVCTANQLANYYDVFALRHPTWSPNDCWKYESCLISDGVHPVVAREIAVNSRQKKIAKKANWIPVLSAFGGLAIYKRDFFLIGHYAGQNLDGTRTCEHVPFHNEITAAGGRIFINPRLINGKWNEHNRHHRLIKRTKRKIKVLGVKFGLSKFI